MASSASETSSAGQNAKDSGNSGRHTPLGASGGSLRGTRKHDRSNRGVRRNPDQRSSVRVENSVRLNRGPDENPYPCELADTDYTSPGWKPAGPATALASIPVHILTAMQRCGTCPIQATCASMGETDRPWSRGIWGGKFFTSEGTYHLTWAGLNKS